MHHTLEITLHGLPLEIEVHITPPYAGFYGKRIEDFEPPTPGELDILTVSLADDDGVHRPSEELKLFLMEHHSDALEDVVWQAWEDEE